MKVQQTIDPVEEAKEFGIDVTLLPERLQRTPTERLEDHNNALAFVEELRKAGKKVHDRLQKNS